jgi:hypothetical protein
MSGCCWPGKKRRRSDWGGTSRPPLDWIGRGWGGVGIRSGPQNTLSVRLRNRLRVRGGGCAGRPDPWEATNRGGFPRTAQRSRRPYRPAVRRLAPPFEGSSVDGADGRRWWERGALARGARKMYRISRLRRAPPRRRDHLSGSGSGGCLSKGLCFGHRFPWRHHELPWSVLPVRRI